MLLITERSPPLHMFLRQHHGGKYLYLHINRCTELYSIFWSFKPALGVTSNRA